MENADENLWMKSMEMSIDMKQRLARNQHILFPALAILSLVLACVIMSAKKFFWYDELLTFYLVTDRSLFHMLEALANGAETGQPLYFVLTWFWAKLFGGSELSLRLFSCAGVCAAYVLIYVILYRTHGLWPSFLGTLAVFCGSSLVLYTANAEARFYGLYLFLCALAIFLYYRACIKEEVSNKLLVSSALVHGGLVLTHPYGFVYSAIFVLSLLLRDAYFKIFRPKLYLFSFLGWLAFLLWIKGYIHQLFIVEEDFWAQRPHLNELADVYLFGIHCLPILIVGIIGMLYLSRRCRSFDGGGVPLQQKVYPGRPELNLSLYLLAYLLFIPPLLAYFFSQIFRSFFHIRYFMPSVMSWAFLLAYLSSMGSSDEISQGTRTYRYVSTPFLVGAIQWLMAGLFLLYPITQANGEPWKKLPGYTDGDFGYKDLPIVYTAKVGSLQFLPRVHYAKHKHRYFYISDPLVSPKLNSVFTDRLLSVFCQYYFPDNFKTVQEFLSTYDAFLYGVNPALNYLKDKWLLERITTNPEYRFSQVKGGAFVLVEKVHRRGLAHLN